MQIVDLAPTILDISGVNPRLWSHMEGVSFFSTRPASNRPIVAEYMLPIEERGGFEGVIPEFDFGVLNRRLKSIQIFDRKPIVSERGDYELYKAARGSR